MVKRALLIIYVNVNRSQEYQLLSPVTICNLPLSWVKFYDLPLPVFVAVINEWPLKPETIKRNFFENILTKDVINKLKQILQCIKVKKENLLYTKNLRLGWYHIINYGPESTVMSDIYKNKFSQYDIDGLQSL